MLLFAVTAFWASQWDNMRFTFTEANLLPDNHPENINYNEFLSLFGEEGSVVVIAVKDPSLFTPKKLSTWKELSEKIQAFEEIDFVLSIDNIKELVKNQKKNKFELKPLLEEIPQDSTRFSLILRLYHLVERRRNWQTGIIMVVVSNCMMKSVKYLILKGY